MSDEGLFREVDEEVRREQMEKLWKRYGNLVVAVALGVIVGVAGYKGWQYYSARQAEKAGAAYVQALQVGETGSPEDVTRAFQAIAEGSHGGYAELARLQVAGALAAEGKTDQAVAAYDEIAADGSVSSSLRDLARIRAAYLLADTADVDTLSRRLAGLDVDGSPWQPSALEILALAHYRQASYLEADKLIAQLRADPRTPAGIMRRAQVMANLLKPLLGDKTGN